MGRGVRGAGRWTVQERGSGACRLVLLHDFTVGGDRAEDAEWVRRATDTNSRAELGRLKDLAERWERLDQLVPSFEDSIRVQGPPEPVYGFLHRVADWPRLLPRVARLEVAEDTPGVQVMTMDTRTADGAAHTTQSVRVCFPDSGRIVYKQTRAPALMHSHTGQWSVVPDASGVTVTSRHTVLLREEAIGPVLGEGTTVAQCPPLPAPGTGPQLHRHPRPGQAAYASTPHAPPHGPVTAPAARPRPAGRAPR
ncbi:SRPBCC family protein [Streptomyces sp. NBC_00391]|uniref:SRPBCC family protein n=1 Tax=Streptomyces sp. NBC_00391 TaxID=2903647 RepID=UPI002E21DC22